MALRRFLPEARRAIAILLAPLVLLAAVLSSTPASAQAAAERAPLLQLGAGDSVGIQVYGQPDMTVTVYVADDGTISVPLAGPVQVAGMSPAQAGAEVEKALRDKKLLVDPHVTLTVVQQRSQRVSVLGQVAAPGRFAVESNTTIFDILALAGGVTESGSDVIYLQRVDESGKPVRYPIDLKATGDGSAYTVTVRGGDSIYVPHAEQFYIYGEVATPGKFKLESGMTVVQAIARAGGVTPRGSQNRVEIKRRTEDGKYSTKSAKLSDLVQAEDVIRVKESIF